MSDRASTFLPSACSGLMYATAPTTCPSRVIVQSLIAPLSGPAVHFSEAEVEQFHPCFRQHDVRGFEVPMNNALFVRALEAICDLLANLERFVDGQSGARQTTAQDSKLRERRYQCSLRGSGQPANRRRNRQLRLVFVT